MKLWQKNYTLNKKIERFIVGEDYVYDKYIIRYDCIASIAHAKMLKKIGILNQSECEKIVEKLIEIIELDKKNLFLIKPEDEDCHTAIEKYLTENLGKIGKKIHTARSRNDQVITALRLYYKNEINTIIQLINKIIFYLKLLRNNFGKIQMPGYTHMKKAMPSSIKLWADSFIESMDDNIDFLKKIYDYIDKSPLGTGAGYGLPIKIDREFTRKMLGFKKIQKNPLYVQNSRGKFESTILHGLNQVMFDLNKISSDLMLFTMDEINYMSLPSNLCTGSSIMPHKKNPDALELIRASYHQIVSYEFSVKNTISNLISGYNRDLQLTKKPVINGFNLTKDCLEAMIIVLRFLKVNEHNCEKAITKELFSTEKVYDLVEKGIPFREAYQQVRDN